MLNSAGDDPLTPPVGSTRPASMPSDAMEQRRPATVRDRLVGRLWAGRYRLLERVGAGGQGAVYRARDERLARTVAVKFPRLDVLADPEVRQRFAREAHAMARLRHPNVLAVHDVGEHQGRPFLVTDWLEGQTLESAMRERRFRPDESARLVAAIARAVHAIHAAGLLHRDLKPANIFLDGNGQPIVMDFGLARELGEARPLAGGAILTEAGAFIGTPGFVAPEQVSGPRARVDGRADVYALGVILYALLASRLPYQGPPLAVLRDSIERDAPPPSQHRDGIPVELQAICLQALARDPAVRFGSAAELADALEQGVAAPGFVRQVKRRQAVLWLRRTLAEMPPWSAAGIALVLTLAAWTVWPRPDRPSLSPPYAPPPADLLPTSVGNAGDEQVRPTRLPVSVEPGRPIGEEPPTAVQRRLSVETVLVGRHRYEVRFRVVGQAELFASPLAPLDRDPQTLSVIIGELALHAVSAGNRAEPTPRESFPLMWVGCSDCWYVDPQSWLLVAMEPVLTGLAVRERAELIEELFTRGRALRQAGVKLLHVPADLTVGPTCAAVRAWLARPSLTGSPAGPVLMPVGDPRARSFPSLREPRWEISEGSHDLSRSAGRILAELAGVVLTRAETLWLSPSPSARPAAVRLLVNLNTAEGFGPNTDSIRQQAAERLRRWLPELAGSSEPETRRWMTRLMAGGRAGLLYRALHVGDRGVPSTKWEQLTAALAELTQSLRPTDVHTSAELRAWLVDCFGPASPLSTVSACRLADQADRD